MSDQSPPIGPPPLAGFYLVDKPYRLSSTSICRVVKRRIMNAGFPRSIKVGHGGTLDPLASGLMVILVGRATKRCDEVMAGEKEYEATVDLSRSSSTDDLEGVLTDVTIDTPPNADAVRSTVDSFVGTILQRPPSHSALRVPGSGGKRAYDVTRDAERRGRPETVPELPHRPVVIHQIQILGYEWPMLRIRVRCGKGTYIRSLARDLGAALGCGGTLHALRRTRVGDFNVEQATPLDDVPDPLLPSMLIPVPVDRPATPVAPRDGR